MRRHRHRLELRVFDRRHLDGQLQPLGNIGSGHRPSVSRGQQRRLLAQLRIQVQPVAHGTSRTLPQRERALLAPLAVQPDAVARPEHDVGHVHADDLGDAGTGVEHERQHQSVPLPDPGVARHVDHRQHLLVRHEADHPALEALHRHGQRVLDHAQVGRVAPGGELQERPYRGQSNITTSHAVVPLSLQVIQEVGQEPGTEVGHRHPVCGQAQLVLGEAQQQHEGVPVRSHRAWAQGALLHHVVGEEFLHEAGERRCGLVAHHSPPCSTTPTKRSNRAPMVSINSGMPDRYQ